MRLALALSPTLALSGTCAPAPQLAFRSIDANGNGSLSRAEVIKAARADASLRALLGLPATIRASDGSHAFFESVFQRLDADDSRAIDLDEFCAAMSSSGGAGGAEPTGGALAHTKAIAFKDGAGS